MPPRDHLHANCTRPYPVAGPTTGHANQVLPGLRRETPDGSADPSTRFCPYPKGQSDLRQECRVEVSRRHRSGALVSESLAAGPKHEVSLRDRGYLRTFRQSLGDGEGEGHNPRVASYPEEFRRRIPPPQGLGHQTES